MAARQDRQEPAEMHTTTITGLCRNGKVAFAVLVHGDDVRLLFDASAADPRRAGPVAGVRLPCWCRLPSAPDRRTSTRSQLQLRPSRRHTTSRNCPCSLFLVGITPIQVPAHEPPMRTRDYAYTQGALLISPPSLASHIPFSLSFRTWTRMGRVPRTLGIWLKTCQRSSARPGPVLRGYAPTAGPDLCRLRTQDSSHVPLPASTPFAGGARDRDGRGVSSDTTVITRESP
ncbi:hypothetical protein OBBRIDRAFT_547684 [Obba rivulosa]|uniref:Uncharacterized protein n=1 Tax=Obba rivulosa TaxID=1052685 RepID=A0A8E2DLM7_9APHY|nr:hypothetical protein OBBRIDRAFT_547684 [Obba rivulosa]